MRTKGKRKRKKGLLTERVNGTKRNEFESQSEFESEGRELIHEATKVQI